MTITKLPRGFAALPADQRKEISRMGGLGTRPEKRNFSRDPEAARIAGRKGGQRLRPLNRAELNLLIKITEAGKYTVVSAGLSARQRRMLDKLVKHGKVTSWIDVFGGTETYRAAPD